MAWRPADLALELQVSQRRIRRILRQRYGTLPEDDARWMLDDEQADYVRARLAEERPLDVTEWSLEIGDTVRRRQIHTAYGGQGQSGRRGRR